MDTLTPRERDCLERVAAGETNEQIARDLCVGPETVHTHLNHLYRRLGVEDAGNKRVLAAVLWQHEQDAREGC